MSLNAREIDFANNYIVNPNAYQAAIDAGYAKSTANHASEWIVAPSDPDKKRHLPYKPELAEYIQNLRGEDDRREEAIMNRVEKKKMLATIARDIKVPIMERLRAMDLDNKMDGEYTTKIQADIDIQPKLEDLI